MIDLSNVIELSKRIGYRNVIELSKSDRVILTV